MSTHETAPSTDNNTSATSPSDLPVGFVGASGLMGHGMAKNLLKAGFALSYSVHHTRPADLDELGARQAESVAELGRTCDVVFVCVTASPDVDRVITGENGLLTDPKPGLIVVDSSTSEPLETRRLGAVCAARGVTLVDAPLTRSADDAERGTLNTLVGATDETLAKIRPLLDAFSENVLHRGELGAAHIIKLLNNFVFQAHAQSYAEAFAVAAAAGVDPGKLTDVLSLGAANSGVLEIMDKTLEGKYDGMQFALDNARKDVRYYTRLAADLSVPSTIGDGVRETLDIASALGFGDKFYPSTVEAQAKLNNVTIRRADQG